jgi:hypothetical protein
MPGTLAKTWRATFKERSASNAAGMINSVFLPAISTAPSVSPIGRTPLR